MDEVVTLEAKPYAGYEFIQWTDGSTENPRSVTVTDNAIYTALFTPPVDTKLPLVITDGVYDVYDLMGRHLKTEGQNLPSGTYIIRTSADVYKIVIP